MDRFGIELHLAHVAEAREKWKTAYLTFKSEVDFMLARLLNEAAAKRMSLHQIAKALNMEPDKLRDLMRTHNLDPHKTRKMLSRDAAEALAENAALLSIEPWEMDLMSPLAYLPMGEELRAAIEDASKMNLNEYTWVAEKIAPGRSEDEEYEFDGADQPGRKNWRIETTRVGPDEFYEVYEDEYFIATFNSKDEAEYVVALVAK